jgi:hypothetical protein
MATRGYHYRPPRIYAAFAAIFTVILIILTAAILLKFDDNKIEAYGTALGSSATAITLCWLVAGYWLQRHVLDKQSHDQMMQRVLIRQQAVVLLLDKYMISFNQVARRLHSSLYPSFDGPPIPPDRDAIQLLLQQVSLGDDLKEAYSANHLVPLVHAASYLSKYADLTALLAPDPELEEHDLLMKKLIDGNNVTLLARRLDAAMKSLPELGPDFSRWD